MTNEEIEQNIIPYLKSLEEKARKLKNDVEKWKEPHYKHRHPKFYPRVVEIILGFRTFPRELFEKNKEKLAYRFQYEFSFLAGKFLFAQVIVIESQKKGDLKSWEEIKEFVKDWEAYLLVLENLSSLLFIK